MLPIKTTAIIAAGLVAMNPGREFHLRLQDSNKELWASRGKRTDPFEKHAIVINKGQESIEITELIKRLGGRRKRCEILNIS